MIELHVGTYLRTAKVVYVNPLHIVAIEPFPTRDPEPDKAAVRLTSGKVYTSHAARSLPEGRRETVQLQEGQTWPEVLRDKLTHALRWLHRSAQ